MQNEIKTIGKLLDGTGNIREKGWGRSNLLEYHRSQIKASNYLIKEWDYYAVLNEDFGIALTIADNGYIGIVAASVFDFTSTKIWTNQMTVPFPLGSFNMPQSSSHGDIRYNRKGFKLNFLKTGSNRTLEIKIDDFFDGKSLVGEITLIEPQHDTLMIATPFKNPNKFYYNHKINNMLAKGQVTFDKKILDFSSTKSFGVLDWGRGVWPYASNWYWGSVSSEINGHSFGFNIGYGFGDTKAATENIVFYDGIGHKLDQINFQIPKDNYLNPWIFSSNDKRFELTFEPIVDRNSTKKIFIIESVQHQVFGYFSGNVILDDGQKIHLDRVFGFAEKVMNKW